MGADAALHELNTSRCSDLLVERRCVGRAKFMGVKTSMCVWHSWHHVGCSWSATHNHGSSFVYRWVIMACKIQDLDGD